MRMTLKAAAFILADELKLSLSYESYPLESKAKQVAIAMSKATDRQWTVLKDRNGDWLVIETKGQGT